MRRLFTLLLLVGAVTAHAGEPRPLSRIPKFAHSTGPGDAPPLWVSSSLAIVNGRIQPDLFDPAFLRRIERNLTRNPNSCTSYLSLGSLHVPEGETIEDRVGLSYSVITGVITAAEQGFYRGTPGTAFELKVSGRPKVLGHSASAEALYIFVASADIPIATGHICSTPLPGTQIPEIGDRAVAFASMPAQDEDRQFVLVNSKGALILERRGTLVGRVEAKAGAVRDLDAVVRAIEGSDGLRSTPNRRTE